MSSDNRRRANELSGRDWTRNSISVWNDIRRTAPEAALKHPALFPEMLVTRLVECFTHPERRVVLDPFAGSGSTLVAACRAGGEAIGFEIAEEYLALARERLGALPPEQQTYRLHPEPASAIPDRVGPGEVDLCVTSPPYWNILQRTRTADGRGIRDYPAHESDLSRIDDYPEFLERLTGIFRHVGRTLRPGAYCVVNVMDIRKKDRFYPFHSDLATSITTDEASGMILDDIIVWDRRADYNSLRPLGYPAVFRINKIHEFLLIFRKRTGVSEVTSD